MRSFFIDISGVERKNRNFPPVSKIFCSQEYVAHRVTPVKKNFFEICLRLESESPVCHDIVNNEKISAAYPNCVWKKPMQTFAICDKSSRESIAFLWAPEAETFFSSNGLIPEKGFCHFAMNNDIQFLVRKFYRLVNNIYFPGVADQVDWLALCICREIIFASSNCKNEISMQQ
ncbi:MAG: hypothetical protein IKA87_05555 [Lentisphaeria bacterium]|nr:hypothetical protein [Lentisphaeria bacterium]